MDNTEYRDHSKEYLEEVYANIISYGCHKISNRTCKVFSKDSFDWYPSTMCPLRSTHYLCNYTKEDKVAAILSVITELELDTLTMFL